MSIISDVGSAIAAEINSNRVTFAQSFTADFSYADWELKLETDHSLRVDVVPVSTGYTIERGTTQKFKHTIPFDIAVRKKLDASDRSDATGRIDTATVSGLTGVWQQLVEMWLPTNPTQLGPLLANVPDAEFIELRPTAAWVKKHLAEWGQYTGLIRVTFELYRTPSP